MVLILSQNMTNLARAIRIETFMTSNLDQVDLGWSKEIRKLKVQIGRARKAGDLELRDELDSELANKEGAYMRQIMSWYGKDSIIRRTRQSRDLEGNPVIALDDYEQHILLLQLEDWELKALADAQVREITTIDEDGVNRLSFCDTTRLC